MRIVAGRYKGLKLTAPEGMDTRPTTDRVRESLFNVLEHGQGVRFDGLRVLDLFAGTGALGLEALSRGAAFALFIDDASSARAAIRTNMMNAHAQGVAKIFRRDATKLGDPGTMPPFDLVFCDPPYGKGLGERAISTCLNEGWLKADALIVLEEAKGITLDLPNGLDIIDERVYGGTAVHLLRATQYQGS